MCVCVLEGGGSDVGNIIWASFISCVLSFNNLRVSHAEKKQNLFLPHWELLHIGSTCSVLLVQHIVKDWATDRQLGGKVGKSVSRHLVCVLCMHYAQSFSHCCEFFGSCSFVCSHHILPQCIPLLVMAYQLFCEPFAVGFLHYQGKGKRRRKKRRGKTNKQKPRTFCLFFKWGRHLSKGNALFFSLFFLTCFY